MKTLLLLTSLFWALLASTPVDIWNTLEKLRFKISFDKELDDIIFEPIATPAIRALEGKYITIKGFQLDYLELEEQNNKKLFISKYYLYSVSCIQPEQEHIIQISLNKELQLAEEKAYTFRGKFHLNESNLQAHPFQLHEAECLDCP
jgi:hypothetical protein